MFHDCRRETSRIRLELMCQPFAHVWGPRCCTELRRPWQSWSKRFRRHETFVHEHGLSFAVTADQSFRFDTRSRTIESIRRSDSRTPEL
jgi:hypothetical protein